MITLMNHQSLIALGVGGHHGHLPGEKLEESEFLRVLLFLLLGVLGDQGVGVATHEQVPGGVHVT